MIAIQDRLGTNLVDKFGLVRSLADALKLVANKIIPPAATVPLVALLVIDAKRGERQLRR